jgi:hypothetical protein
VRIRQIGNGSHPEKGGLARPRDGSPSLPGLTAAAGAPRRARLRARVSASEAAHERCFLNPCLKKRSPPAWRTNCRRTYERPSLLTGRHCRLGRTSRHSRAMNGYAGSNPQKNPRPGTAGSKERARGLSTESAGLVVGRAALIVEIKKAACARNPAGSPAGSRCPCRHRFHADSPRRRFPRLPPGRAGRLWLRTRAS